MGFWMDDVLLAPPPGFPAADPDQPPPFVCEAPEPAAPVPPAEASDGERKP
jgi:hypothetical protein